MVGLLRLPNELLAIIFGGLDAQGFSALRLSSKSAKVATLLAFISRYFQTRYIMLLRLSLENLVEIARHLDFGPAVRTLELCTDHFVEFPDLGSHLVRHKGDIVLAIQEGRYPPAALGTDEGNKVAYITQALISLTNIEAIEVPFLGRVLRITLTAIATSGTALSSLAITASVLSRAGVLSREAIAPDILRPSESHFQYYKNLPPSLTELILNVSARATRGAEDRWTDDLLAFIGVNRLKQLVPKLQLLNLQYLGFYRRSLFALIRYYLPRLELSIKLYTVGGLTLEFEDCFNVGGGHEAWTKAIELIETR
ncbi:hypothetical protein C8A01DRAFT_50445 [Parachaetomium inaequale]|uniref:F-box domain-containing protein n=1 Tax=Parachaetomium inaequale TaxID=2588326 RepID=A0AAN6P746_9PEZI|nr:hypothetical protein C8A01DRAFT_50445 [Parachaetomium inaequale]